MSNGKPSTKTPTCFDGEFWNVDPNSPGVTRLQFLARKGRRFVAAWGSCFAEDCEWGETELFPLDDLTRSAGAAESAFATWRFGSDQTHMLFKSTRSGFLTETITLKTQPPFQTRYYTQEHFHKDAVRSAAPRDALQRFSRMWDGSEPGWRLVRYRQPVYFVEFCFRQSGPTRSEFAAVKEHLKPFPGETEDELWKRMRGCTGVMLDHRPIGETRLRSLKALQRRAGKCVVFHTVPAGDLLALSPTKHFYPFHYVFHSWRKPVIAKMLEAGVKILTRDLK